MSRKLNQRSVFQNDWTSSLDWGIQAELPASMIFKTDIFLIQKLVNWQLEVGERANFDLWNVSFWIFAHFCGENLDFFSYESECRTICRESGWGAVVMGSKYEYFMQLCLWKCHNETHYFVCELKYFLEFFKCHFYVVKFKISVWHPCEEFTGQK